MGIKFTIKPKEEPPPSAPEPSPTPPSSSGGGISFTPVPASNPLNPNYDAAKYGPRTPQEETRFREEQGLPPTAPTSAPTDEPAPGAGIPTLPTPTTLTRQEYQQELHTGREKVGEIQTTLHKMETDPGLYFTEIEQPTEPGYRLQSQFQPHVGSYLVPTSFISGDPTHTGAKIMTAEELIPLLGEKRADVAKIEMQYQTAISESSVWHPETEIKKTDKGYEVIFPDTSLEWSKGEFGKIEKAYEIHPLLGATAELGFGTVSSLAALGKPVAQLFTDEPLPHYPSPLDVAFEPLGLSPEGSTELIGSHPVAMSGGIWGEFLQLAGFHYALKPITTGVSVGVKGIVKRIPSVYGKFTKVFPEERFITGAAGRVAGTKTGEQFLKWGVKGHRFGWRLAPGGAKITEEVTKKGIFRTRDILQKTVTGGRKVERVLLSPSQHAKAQKDIAAKLAMGPQIDILFPKTGADMAHVAIRDPYKLGGLLGTKLTRKTRYIYTGFVKPSGLESQIVRPGVNLGKYTGFMRKSVKGGVHEVLGTGDAVTYLKPSMARRLVGYTIPDDILKSGKWSSAMKLDMDRGIPIFLSQEERIGLVQAGTRAGKLSAFSKLQEPYLKVIMSDPMKAWAAAARKASISWKIHHPSFFWKTEQATQQLIPKITTEPVVKKTVFSPGRLGLIQSLQAPIVIKDISPVVFTTPLFAGLRGATGYLDHEQKTQRITIPTVDRRLDSALARSPVDITELGQISLPGSKQSPIQIQALELAQGQEQMQGQILELAQAQDLLFRPGTKAHEIPWIDPILTPKIPVGGFFIFPRGMAGEGRTDIGFGFITPFARRRKHPTKDILKELEDVGLYI